MCRAQEDQLGELKAKNDENVRQMSDLGAQKARLQTENGKDKTTMMKNNALQPLVSSEELARAPPDFW